MQNSIEQVTKAAEQTTGNQSIIILITGFVVVFLVLLLLIGLIKIYSGIVSAVQKKAASKSKAKNPAEAPAPAADAPVLKVAPESASDDLQTIAVITAAVEAYYGGSKKVKVTGIRPVSSARSEWATAGLRENIPAMRSEGLL